MFAVSSSPDIPYFLLFRRICTFIHFSKLHSLVGVIWNIIWKCTRKLPWRWHSNFRREVWTSCIRGRAMFPSSFEFSNIYKCHCTPITIHFFGTTMGHVENIFPGFKRAHIFKHAFTVCPCSGYNIMSIADILYCVWFISEFSRLAASPTQHQCYTRLLDD